MRSTIFLILFTIFSTNLFAQDLPESEDKDVKQEVSEEHFLTGKELIGTRNIMKKYTQSLTQTLDVEQALKGISVDDWCTRTINEGIKEAAREDDSNDENEGISFSEMLKSSVAPRLYILYGNYFNMWVLYELILPEDHEEDDCVPAEVRAISRQNPLLSSIVESTSLETNPVRSISQLEDLAKTSTELVQVFEKNLRWKIQENPELYSSKILKLEKESLNKVPSIEVLKKSEYGLPVGTRLITTYVNYFELKIADVGDGLKVYGVVFFAGN